MSGNPFFAAETLWNSSLKDADYPFKVTTRDQTLTYRGLTIPGHFVALFRAACAAPLGKVPKGGEITLRGNIEKLEFEGRGRTLGLTVTLKDAQTQ